MCGNWGLGGGGGCVCVWEGIKGVDPLVQYHSSTSESTLKIPNTGTHTTVWTHENIAHTDRNG